MFRFGRSRFIRDHFESHQIRASREAFYYSPAATTRANHGLYLSPARPLIENRDAEPAPAIALPASQAELEIVDERIRRQPIAPPVTRTPQSRHFL